jgi:hypothetical protein
MQSKATTVEEYMKELPAGRQDAMTRLRKEIKENLPAGFTEVVGYGMIGYVVPHTLYPKGYHCDPKAPLPFMNIASQKNFIAIYHMGIYADAKLLNWFVTEYAKKASTKLDMGKSCIRFKNPGAIPFDLVGELAGKMSVQDWIKVYERNFKKAGNGV